MWYFVTANEYTSPAELPSTALKNFFIHLAVLGLHRCLGFSLVAASRGLLFSCGAWASRCLRLLLLWSLSSGCVDLHSCRQWARSLRLPGSRAQAQ